LKISSVWATIDPGRTPRFPRLNATSLATPKIVFDAPAAAKCSSMRRLRRPDPGWPRPTSSTMRTIGYGLNTTGTYVGDASGGVLTITDGTHSSA